MSQDAFNFITAGQQRLIFPTYHSFLGSLGLLLSQMEDHEYESSSSQSNSETNSPLSKTEEEKEPAEINSKLLRKMSSDKKQKVFELDDMPAL